MHPYYTEAEANRMDFIASSLKERIWGYYNLGDFRENVIQLMYEDTIRKIKFAQEILSRCGTDMDIVKFDTFYEKIIRPDMEMLVRFVPDSIENSGTRELTAIVLATMAAHAILLEKRALRVLPNNREALDHILSMAR